MAKTTRSVATRRPDDTHAASTTWLAFFDPAAASAAFDMLLQAQQQQWDAIVTWQRSLAEWQQDHWDHWFSHWGGGVPIDA